MSPDSRPTLSLSSEADTPASRAEPPPLPASTRAWRRALDEARCADLCAKIYGDTDLDLPAFVEFAHPPGRKGKAAELRAFAIIEDGVAHLCFRGTDRLGNWASNLHLGPVGEPHRHAGFEAAWRRLQPQVTSWLDAAHPRELVITGHSLGGAMAQMAAFELAAQWPVTAVVCFGAPLIGWQPFARAYAALPLCGRTDTKLGDVTTNFVFKSDLVPHLVLPWLGCRSTGRVIVIDETGRPSDEYVSWYVDALATTYSVIAGDEADPVAAGLPAKGGWKPLGQAQAAFRPWQAGSAGAIQPPTTIDLRGAVDRLRPMTTSVVQVVPQLQALVLAVGAAMVAFLSARFFARDFGYHSSDQRYAIALQARVERWVPLAYLEQGNTMLAAGDALGALPYLEHALDAAVADSHDAGVDSPVLEQLIWNQRLSLAAAQTALQDHEAAIASLGTLIAAYPPVREVAAGPDGEFEPGPQIIAIGRRAVAFELAGQHAAALTDYATLLALKPDLNQPAFFALRRRAQASLAVDAFTAAFDFRGDRVRAETNRLLNERRASFERNMAPTWARAHLGRARSAYNLNDHVMAIAEASSALDLGVTGSQAYRLRAAAYEKLRRFDEALQDCTRAVEADPEHADVVFERARMHLMSHQRVLDSPAEPGKVWIDVSMPLDEREGVMRDLHRTLALQPSHPGASWWLERLAQAVTSVPQQSGVATKPAPSPTAEPDPTRSDAPRRTGRNTPVSP